MDDGKRRQPGHDSAGILAAITLVSVMGCGAERFTDIGDGESPVQVGSGGTGFDNDSSSVLVGTGGSGGSGTEEDANPTPIGSGGAGPDIDGGSGATVGSGGADGTGGRGTGGGGGSAMDSRLDSSSEKARPLDATDAGSAPSDAGSCPGGTKDLSNVGTADFKISFRITTKQSGWVAILNQRDICSFGTFWDIRQSGTNKLHVEIDDNSSPGYENLESTVAINDGRPHNVSVARVAGKLTIRVDGVAAGEAMFTTALGALPPLSVGDDICVGTVNNPVTAAFSGTLTDVCITRSN